MASKSTTSANPTGTKDIGVSYDAMRFVANAIAQCDFRVTAQQYQTGKGYPWVLTVGENHWRRHLVIKSVEDHGAELELLPATQTLEMLANVELLPTERQISLRELISGNYTGVKTVLGALPIAA